MTAHQSTSIVNAATSIDPLLLELIQSYDPLAVQDASKLEYYQELVQCTLAPVLPRDDLASLTKTVQKKLLKDDPSGIKSVSFSNSLDLLKKNELSELWSIVYFMFRNASTNKDFSSFRRLTDPLSMTELTTTLIRESKNDSYPHVSKSLKEWNLFMEKYGVLSESQILSELLFVLQGGQSVHFQLNEDNKQYLIEPSCHISKGFIFIVKDAFQVAEDCRYISEYVLNIQQKQTASTGQIHDSFVSWLHDLLKDYYKEIASFETKVFKSVEKQYEVAIIQPQGLGLRRLKGLLSCPKARLNLAKTLILDFQGKSGCDILRICTEYIHTGDMLLSPLIRSLVDKIVSPTLSRLDRWIFSGELIQDEKNEFFIVEATANSNGNGEENLISEDAAWEQRFSIDSSKLPFFVTGDLSEKILVMGKSVWFVKSKCETLDMPSIPNISLLNNKTLLYDLSLGSKQEFTRLITESYEIMAPGLLKALLGDPRYAFFPHLLSLKNYLLCHRGDFCQALMDALASELSKPASHIHRHNLIGNLDVVLKQTVADPEAEKRLDVRLLNAVGNLSGWEIFSLDYHAETPLNTLLSSTAMATYTRAFRFIWRLKRCEHLLASAWKFLSLSSRSTNPISENNQSLFLLSHLTLTDMIQFVDKVMYYLTMVVIEGSWKELEVSLSQAKDLDIYLKSHQAFLDRILLNGTFSRGTTGDESSSRTLQQKLFQLLQLILSFAKHQSTLQKVCKELRRLKANKAHEIASRTEKGDWGLSEKEESDYQDQENEILGKFERLFTDVNHLSSQFRIEKKSFLDLLREYSEHYSSYAQLHFLLQ